MKNLDMRKINKQTSRELKQIAVAAVLSMPRKNIAKVAKQYNIRRKTLSDWVNKYSSGGNKSLYKDNRGAKKWQNTALTKSEENWVRKTIANKYPEQMQLAFMLWNRRAVKDLIKKKYHKKLGLTTISRLLDKWNMTPQKPRLRSYKQQPKEIQDWIDKKYPQIKEEAKTNNAQIHWCDETCVSSREIIARGYSKKGKTPILMTSGSRFSVNMISTVTNAGESRFMLFEKGMNATKFIEFLRRLTKEQKQKIYLIVDNARVHHAKIVKTWEERYQDKIKLIYLPAYAPEHNPDEYLNQTLKIRLKNRPKDKTRSSLQKSIKQEMKSLQNSKEIIKSLFDAPHVRYARG